MDSIAPLVIRAQAATSRIRRIVLATHRWPSGCVSGFATSSPRTRAGGYLHHRRLESCRNLSGFTGWLRRIVVTVAINTVAAVDSACWTTAISPSSMSGNHLVLRQRQRCECAVNADDEDGGFCTSLPPSAGAPLAGPRRRRVDHDANVAGFAKTAPGIEVATPRPSPRTSVGLPATSLTACPPRPDRYSGKPFGRVVDHLREFSGCAEGDLPGSLFWTARTTIGDDALYTTRWSARITSPELSTT